MHTLDGKAVLRASFRVSNSKPARFWALLLLAVGMLAALGAGSVYAQSFDVPDWVKNTALFWAQGDITDQDFVAVLQFLINEGIVTVPAGVVDVVEDEPSADLPFTINIRFEEPRYDSGATARMHVETDATESERVKIGVFDSSSNILY